MTRGGAATAAATLSHKQARCVALTLEGLDAKTIATRLGVNDGTIRLWQRSAAFLAELERGGRRAAAVAQWLARTV